MPIYILKIALECQSFSYWPYIFMTIARLSLQHVNGRHLAIWGDVH